MFTCLQCTRCTVLGAAGLAVSRTDEVSFQGAYIPVRQENKWWNERLWLLWEYPQMLGTWGGDSWRFRSETLLSLWFPHWASSFCFLPLKGGRNFDIFQVDCWLLALFDQGWLWLYSWRSKRESGMVSARSICFYWSQWQCVFGILWHFFTAVHITQRDKRL